MGRRGPKRTPTAILKARGSWRGKTRAAGPEAAPGRPDPPVYLRPAARKHWDYLADLLEEMGVLAELDGDMLGAYCQTIAKWEDNELFLEENGATYDHVGTTGKKNPKMRPEVQYAKTLWAEIKQFAALFGLTPANRAEMIPITKPKAGENRGKTGKSKQRFFNKAANAG